MFSTELNRNRTQDQRLKTFNGSHFPLYKNETINFGKQCPENYFGIFPQISWNQVILQCIVIIKRTCQRKETFIKNTFLYNFYISTIYQGRYSFTYSSGIQNVFKFLSNTSYHITKTIFTTFFKCKNFATLQYSVEWNLKFMKMEYGKKNCSIYSNPPTLS